MLFSPVYIEAHPRRMAAHVASCISSNSFASYSFRTLASHFQTSVSSNLFEIKRFRTLCKIPGIGYPPLATRHSPLATRHSPLAIYPLCFQSLPDSFAQWAPATLFHSIACGLFPLQWGCIPPSSSSAYLLLLFPEINQIRVEDSILPGIATPALPERFDPFGRLGFHSQRSTGHGPRPAHITLGQLTTSNRAGETAVGLPYARAHLFDRGQSKQAGGLR
jgi:hypothetical protein